MTPAGCYPSDRFEYDVRGTDTDPLDHLQMHAIFSMMQEAASLHAGRLGFGADQFDPRGLCWMLLRVSVRMKEFPSWRERIVIETWPSGMDRLFALRDFRFLREDGRTIGAATTSWLVVDRNSHRPKRFVPPAQDDDASEFPLLPRSLGFDAVKLEPEADLAEADPVLRHICRASDIDRNQHVNNTRYVAWCLDALQMDGRPYAPVYGIDMNYLSELRLSDEAILYALPRGEGTVVIEGRVPGGDPVFRARLLSESTPESLS